MIGRLSGTLLDKAPPALLLDVAGVGYELEAPMSTFYALPAPGEALALHVHLVVREDAQLLYGFATLAERSLFRALLKVSGVGAKVALSILSGMSVDGFIACVAGDDVSALVRVPGIGKKTAERLIVEMRDRAAAMGAGSLPGLSPDLPGGTDGGVRAQAAEALESLGYKGPEAKRLLDRAEAPGQSVEALIRAALRLAAG